jgi:predicted nicotinamide N-methyase
LYPSKLFSIHTVQGLQFEETDIYLEKLGYKVRILEASKSSQDSLEKSRYSKRLLDLTGGGKKREEDPYCAVLWPAAVAVGNRLCELDLKDKTVLDLGAGTGMVSFVATICGAQRVIACDYNPLALESIALASTLQSNGPLSRQVLQVCLFNILDVETPLPSADIVVIADMLYTKELGIAVAKRVLEAKSRGSVVIIGDSPNRAGRPYFLEELAALGWDVSFTFEDLPESGSKNTMISTAPQSGYLSVGLLEL